MSLPCVHPADGSIHAVSVVERRLRGGVEFVGGDTFLDGSAPPVVALGIEVNGVPVELGTSQMAWQRTSEWLPTFNATVGALTIRGTLFAPFGRGADFPGFVYAVSFENRGSSPLSVTFAPSGTLGARLHRVRSPRRFDDGNVATVFGDVVVLCGASPSNTTALALAVDNAVPTTGVTGDGGVTWSFRREISVAPGGRVETAVYGSVAPERDGACAMVETMRARGWRQLSEETRKAIGALEQATGTPAIDRFVNRHIIFTYFYSVVRAIDDAHLYLVRSRAPWNGHAYTSRDWDALMWTIPAVRLADQDLARELLFRVCEVHGYAPGRGVNYLDGTPFQLGFSLDAVAAYAVATDRYIAQTGDDRIVEEPALADTLYTSYDELQAHRDTSKALYSTQFLPSGRPAPLPYVLHTNAIVADALDILKNTLDEKTAEKVEDGGMVRSAAKRHFSASTDESRALFVAATDLAGVTSSEDDPVASLYWLPTYEMVEPSDTTYRRTVKRLAALPDPAPLSSMCAALVGPDSRAMLDQLRRATLDNGLAAELVNADGDAVSNGGDAALSGLLGYSAWYAVTVLGIRL